VVGEYCRHDKTTTNIILSFAEIKGFAESLVKHPDNDTERIIGEHILLIIDRQFGPEATDL
jgi:hypothetical protein